MSEKLPSPPNPSSQEGFQESEMPKAIEAIGELREDFYIHGHGTGSKKDADSILEHGLYTNSSVLGTFSHTLPVEAEEIERELSFWNYDLRKCVVLIAVPKHPDYYDTYVAADGRDAFENEKISEQYANEHIFEQVNQSEVFNVNKRSDKRIPSKRLIGYWDADAKAFHANPRFVREREIAQ